MEQFNLHQVFLSGVRPSLTSHLYVGWVKYNKSPIAGTYTNGVRPPHACPVQAEVRRLTTLDYILSVIY